MLSSVYLYQKCNGFKYMFNSHDLSHWLQLGVSACVDLILEGH